VNFLQDLHLLVNMLFIHPLLMIGKENCM
jgi:hypothetical protein